MNYAIILSGGTGCRVKGIEVPKQYYIVEQKPVFYYCMKTIAAEPLIDYFIIVASKEWRQFIQKYTAEYADKFIGFVEPGENRQLSIYHALMELQKRALEDDMVLVHDAARPMLSEQLLRKCICEAAKADGAMPVVPMKDTVYFSKDGKNIDSLLEREHIYAGQAPEVFHYGKYLRANEALLPNEILKINGSSEAAMKAGMTIRLLDGEERNFKITTDRDLEQFQKMMSGEK